MEDALSALATALIDWFSKDPKNLLWIGAVCSVYALAVKLWLKQPSPADPMWKRIAWALARVADRASLNSEPVSSIVKRTSSFPPKPNVPPGATLMLALGILLASSTACGAPLTRHARVIEAAAPTVQALHDAIRHELDADRADILERIHEPAEQAAALESMLDTYRPVLASYAVLSEALHAYYEAVERASKEGRATLDPQLLSSIAIAWEALRNAAEVARVDLPDAADALRALHGGAR